MVGLLQSLPLLTHNLLIRFVQNTIYDEERIDVVAPPALARGLPPVQPLVRASNDASSSVLNLSAPFKVPTPLSARRELHTWPFDMDNIAGNALDDELRQADIIEFDRRMRAFPEAVLVRLLSHDLRCCR